MKKHSTEWGGYSLVNYCEIDKYASKAYALIHNTSEDKNLKDVTQIDTSTLPKDIDLITYGFPCQDISLAGKQKGLEDENGKTRSGLVFDALRIIGDCKPKYAVCENVKNLTGKKFKAEFATILNILEEMGYNNYWKVLNAADYGVPQKRERVFIVSIRKDIDTGTFEFPKPFTLTKRLRDVLEDEVNEKYYLSEKLVNFFYENTLKNKAKGNGFAFNPVLQEEVGGVIAKTITTREGCRMENNFIKTIGYYQPSCHEASRVLDPDGIAPTVKENHGTVNAIKLDELTTGVSDAYRVYNADGLARTIKAEAGGLGAKTGLYKLSSDEKEIIVYDDFNRRIPKNQSVVGTVRPTFSRGSHNGYKIIELNKHKTDIRKLTPKECFRLMGFEDKDFEVCKTNGISDTQLYKMAGNSIVVDVLYYIFKNLFKE